MFNFKKWFYEMFNPVGFPAPTQREPGRNPNLTGKNPEEAPGFQTGKAKVRRRPRSRREIDVEDGNGYHL